MVPVRVILLFIMNFIVGWLVSQGYVPIEHADQLSQQLVDATGYLLIFLTSVTTIIHSFHKPHPTAQPVNSIGLIVAEVIKQLTLPAGRQGAATPLSPIAPKINATPPPSQPVQEKSSNDGWLKPGL